MGSRPAANPRYLKSGHLVNEEDFEYLCENNFILTEVLFTERCKEFCKHCSEDGE
jgi:hypothetical protein